MRLRHPRRNRLGRPASVVGVAAFLALAASGCTPPGGPPDEEPSPSPTESTPAPLSDTDAARAFFDAVVAGDRDAAVAVATDAAVAFFEPWEPSPGLTLEGPQDGAFFINPGAAPFQCTVENGLVQGCLDEPSGEPELSDEEAAQAFFDAVVAGDRDAAVAVATDAAVAFFEPWEPSPGLTLDGPQDGVFFINPGAAPFQCTVENGLVQGCLDEPTGD